MLKNCSLIPSIVQLPHSVNSSAGNIATETHTSHNRHPQHGYQGNRWSQVTRRELPHDWQQPFSIICSSDTIPPNVDISQVNPEHRSNGNRRERLRNLVTTSGISTSCFDVWSTPENQQRSRQTDNTWKGNEGESHGPNSLVQSGLGALQTANTVLASRGQPCCKRKC